MVDSNGIQADNLARRTKETPTMTAQQLQQALAGRRIVVAQVAEYGGDIETITLHLDDGHVFTLSASAYYGGQETDPYIEAKISR